MTSRKTPIQTDAVPPLEADPAKLYVLRPVPEIQIADRVYPLNLTRHALEFVYLGARSAKERFIQRIELASEMSPEDEPLDLSDQPQIDQAVRNINTSKNRFSQLEGYLQLSATYKIEQQKGRGLLRWNMPCDLEDYRSAIREQRLEDALQLYGGGFLSALRDVSEYGALRELRLETQGSWYAALVVVAQRYAQQRQYQLAFDLWAQLLDQSLSDDESASEFALPEEQWLGQVAELCSVLGEHKRGLAWLRTLERYDDSLITPFLRSLMQQLEHHTPINGLIEYSVRLRDFPFAHGFIGREVETERLHRLLSTPDVRLVTVCGAGGIGKSFLARSVAQSRANDVRYHDGVVFVSLDGSHSLGLAFQAMADALMLRLARDTSPRTQLMDYLAHRTMLLLLDNAEVCSEIAAFIGELQRAAPNVQVLATSQVPLMQPIKRLLLNEQRLDLAGMSDEDAWLLYQASCKRKGNHSSASKTSLEQFSRDVVGGSPLALELASSNPRLEAWLEQQSTDGALWQHLLRWVASVDSELLKTFTELAIFPGDFTADDASSITGTTLKQILSLQRASLLEGRPRNRFGLHPLLHRLALQRLPEDDAVKLRERHATHFARLAERMVETLDTDPFAPVQDYPNLNAAWDWLESNPQVEGGLLVVQARLAWILGEVERTERLCLSAEQRGLDLRGQVQLELLRCESSRSASLHRSIEHAYRAVEITQSLGEVELEARALIQAGLSCLHRDLDEAAAFFQRAIAAVAGISEAVVGIAQRHLARVLIDQRDYPAATACIEAAIQSLAAAGLHNEHARALTTQAVIALRSNDLELATACLRQSNEIYIAISPERTLNTQALNWGNLARVYVRLERFDEAQALLKQAQTVFAKAGDDKNLINVLGSIGELNQTLERWGEAKTAFVQTLNTASRVGSRIVIYETLYNLAVCLAHSGHIAGFTDALGILEFVAEDGDGSAGVPEHIKVTALSKANALRVEARTLGETRFWGVTLEEVVSAVLQQLQ